jgi:hypothetical protein
MISNKFGDDVLQDVLSVTKPDAAGLSSHQKYAGYIANLALASERALWVCAADKLHNSRCTISDLRRATNPDDVWKRFKTGRSSIEWYQEIIDALERRGFNAPIMTELRESINELSEYAAGDRAAP